MENNQGEKGKRIYLAIIIFLLLGNGVAFYLLYSETQARNDVETQRVTLEQNMKTLNDTLDSKKMQLEQLRGKNSELDSMITQQESEIDKQKGEIAVISKKGRMTSEELAKAKDMISHDEASIADLQKKVDELNKQNTELTNQNQQLNTDLSSVKQNAAQLTEQNQGLSKKVAVGSLFQPKDIKVEGVSKKKNGKEAVEKKIKKVESLKVSFETGEDKLLEPGTVSVYVRILNPKGETISVADQGSGTFQNAANETVQYTKKADIDWNQTSKKIDIYWSSIIKDPGVYKVELYQNGYPIGKGEVDLR